MGHVIDKTIAIAATFMRGDSEGQINLLYPDLNRIFAIRS